MVDVEAVAERSMKRVERQITSEAPCYDNGVICPFCGRDLVVRRTILGRLDVVPDTTKRPHIDGVELKCAGDGCGFRPDFDVPLVAGKGYWPELSQEAEYQRELSLRDEERIVDMGYTPSEGSTIQQRLRELGYLR